MSSVYADVIVDITNEKLDRTFQYKVPPELTGEIGPGTAVQIPFGNGNRTITGYVLSVGNEPKYPQDRMKAILAVQKDAATVETKLIALAAWMRHTYGSTMIQALKTVLPVKVKARGKETREIALLADPAECEELLENYRKKNYKARIRLLNALLAQPVLPGPVVSKELKITADTLHVMEEQGVLEIRRTSTWRNPVSDAAGRTTAGKPNEQQQAVVDGIRKEWEGQNRPCLIRGVTGSGKTLVYMELMERVLKEGKQVIVLIPEIALTYQNVERFCARFGTRVTVVNSRMTPSERADQMERARRGEVSIMIGPRSALFAPFPELGLIVIDEEHETSYKSEVTPRYHARETAVRRAGRGEKPGMAVIQTYHPEHYSIQTAAEQDYGTFYEKEMDYRRLMGYPPAAELLAIHGAGEDEAHLTQAMEYIRRYLIRIRGNREVQIIGPASEAVSKINDLYRMAVYVRAPQEEVLAELREKLERYIEINKGFRTVYLQFDFSRKY